MYTVQAKEFTVTNHQDFKQKMLNWANRFSIFCLLDNNGYQFEQPSFECMLAAGARRQIMLPEGNAFARLQQFFDVKPSWLFGHLGYQLKNEVEQLANNKKPAIDFGIGFFFEPEIIIQLNARRVTIYAEGKEENILKEIETLEVRTHLPASNPLFIQPLLSKEAYLHQVAQLKEHIKRGDCYEINFCQTFIAHDAAINPSLVCQNLIQTSPVPFAAFYKLKHNYCICASPERYLRKKGMQLISQPMKGTSKRNHQNRQKDWDNAQYLKQSNKEKSENVMVVDLVRNDLSRICREASVHVKELFGIYSFPQVHQMISTVAGILKEGLHFTDAIKATFPMGSMTGAPKKRVMELIEEYEPVGRGLFSGAIGYIHPHGDFDFNVVIRSIFYDSTQKLLSFSAGSGLTFYSDATKEYEECMLKAEAIIAVLNGKG